MFVSAKENTAKARARGCRLLSPSGEVIDIYNISEFARNNNLDTGCLSRVIQGKSKQHHTWRVYAKNRINEK